jgi:integrase
LHLALERYLTQVETLNKPNTLRKYRCVLNRFVEHFQERLTLPREYTEEDLTRFLAACDGFEKALLSSFVLTGLREQEMVHLVWSNLNFKLRTVRVTAKPQFGFYPKRWEEREIPIPVQLAQMLREHPRRSGTEFVFPSPTGNREQNMLLRCKDVAGRAELDSAGFDVKTFRSTYATRMLGAGFDVRTVQHWMGHKSLETTMRYLVPASEVPRSSRPTCASRQRDGEKETCQCADCKADRSAESATRVRQLTDREETSSRVVSTTRAHGNLGRHFPPARGQSRRSVRVRDG